jgi:hypothetical protein
MIALIKERPVRTVDKFVPFDPVAYEMRRRFEEAAPSPWPCPAPFLRDIANQYQALGLFFEGLQMHFVDALAQGRPEDWRKAAIGCIDLLLCSAPTLQARRIEGDLSATSHEA